MKRMVAEYQNETYPTYSWSQIADTNSSRENISHKEQLPVMPAEEYVERARQYVVARRSKADVSEILASLSHETLAAKDVQPVLQALINEAEILSLASKEGTNDSRLIGEFFWNLGSQLPKKSLGTLNAAKINILVNGHKNNVPTCTEIAQLVKVIETGEPLNLESIRPLSTTERVVIATKENKGKLISTTVAAATLAQPLASFANEAPATTQTVSTANADAFAAGPSVASRVKANISSPEAGGIVELRADAPAPLDIVAGGPIEMRAAPLPSIDPKMAIGATALSAGNIIESRVAPREALQENIAAASKLINVASPENPVPISITEENRGLTPEQAKQRRKMVLGVSPLAEKITATPETTKPETITKETEDLRELTTAREQIALLIQQIDTAKDKDYVDPITATEASELAIALRQYTYDNSVLSMFSKNEIKDILAHAYIGPQALAQKDQAVLETNEDPFFTWVNSLDSKKDQEFLKAAYASIHVTTMDKATLNEFVDFTYASVTDFVDTKIKFIETPKNTGELKNMSDHEIDLLAAQNLAEKGDLWHNRAYAMQFFLEHGFTPEQAAGAIGNFVVESAGKELNPGIKQIGGGPGRGIVQWEEAHSGGGGRANQLYRFADQIGKPWDELDTQLLFIMWEFENTEPGAYRTLSNASTIEEAANAVMNNYERPLERIVTRRLAEAEDLFAGFQAERAKVIAAAAEAEKSATPEPTVPSPEDQKAALEDVGYTEEATNMAGATEMVPRTLNDGTRWHQYISQNSLDIKHRLEAAGLDPDLGSLHMCGLVTIEMIRFSEDGDIANDEAAMSKVYDEIIDEYIWARQNDVFTNPDGGAMWHAKMVDLAEHIGLDVQTLPTMSFDEIKRAFENGASYVTINTNPEKLDENAPIKSGHIFAIRGITKDGKLLLLDPASFERSQIAYEPEMILNYSDPTAVHAMSAPGKMDVYKEIIANEKAAAERAAQEKADEEAAAKKAAEEEAARKKAAEEEAARKKATKEAKNAEQPQPSIYDSLIPKNWHPEDLTDGWAAYQKTIANNPTSGLLDIRKGQLEVVQSGLRENDLHSSEIMFNPDAAKAFRAMNNAYRAEFGTDIPINDSYRSFDDQVELHDTNRNGIYGEATDNNMAAIPGKSPHGRGNAFDANVGPRYSNVYNWLIQNGPIYGFYNPSWMNPASSHSPYATKDEAWHFEFLGNAFILDDLVGGHPDYNIKEINKMYGNNR